MPIRTTAEAVGGIIEVDATIPLTPFIESASALVDEVCAPKLKSDGVTLYYDSVRLELIERWLAAHFYAVRDPRPDMERAGRVAVRNQYRVDLNLSVTTYGQQAMLLDTAGGLAAANINVKKGRRQVGVHWLGTEDTSREQL